MPSVVAFLALGDVMIAMLLEHGQFTHHNTLYVWCSRDGASVGLLATNIGRLYVWTFYALGGLGGFSLPSGFGNTFTMAPRFGAGVEYQTKAALMFRGEVSADFIGAGIALNF